MRITAAILITTCLLGCSSEDANNIITREVPLSISFETRFQRMNEGDKLELIINFTKEAQETGFVEVTISSDNAIANSDFTTNPSSNNNIIDFLYQAGDSLISFEIEALIDNDDMTEELTFSITDASEEIDFSSASDLQIEIADVVTQVDPSEVLTVVTWNIENFPMNGSNTINKVVDLINDMDADIIALQEMRDVSAFQNLDAALTEWQGLTQDVRGEIELAYLYKTSEINSFSSLSVIYPNDQSAFPREPVVATATHVNGLEVTLINIHLKCCDDGNGPSRREDASNKLQRHIDENLASENVIVLGDFNDDITGNNPFDNFINDPQNYEFADMDIAVGSSVFWSYPSWPSHIDHVLITNELFDNFISSETLRLDLEVTGYWSDVSDHRPVSASFSN